MSIKITQQTGRTLIWILWHLKHKRYRQRLNMRSQIPEWSFKTSGELKYVSQIYLRHSKSLFSFVVPPFESPTFYFHPHLTSNLHRFKNVIHCLFSDLFSVITKITLSWIGTINKWYVFVVEHYLLFYFP